MTPSLPLHPGLSEASRVRSIPTDQRMALLEWLTLIGIGGMTAVLSACIDLHVRIPGHAILKVVFPVAAGMALVPRKYAGSVIGVSALVTALPMRALGFNGEGVGYGALTSMTLIGPILDVILSQAKSKKFVYLGFVIAGLASNVLALLVRGGVKWMGWERPGRRPLGEWLAQASVTYVVCGIVAGLISAAVWFSFGDRRPTTKEAQP